MLDIVFYFGTEIIVVRVAGKRISFSYTGQEGTFADVSKLRLNREGVLKEHPDLKDAEDWEEQALKRLEKHLFCMANEDAVAEYVKSELMKFGYIPKMQMRRGFRPVKL